MKRVLLYIGIAIAAIGCTKSEVAEYTPATGEITLSAGVTTRLDSDDDCKWDADGDDRVGIFTNQSGESNLKFSVDSEDGDMTNMSKTTLTILDEGTRTYFAYYPFIESQGATKSINLANGYTTPLLWAKATSNDTDVTLLFKHMLPKVTFTITAGGKDETSLSGATVTLKGAYNETDFDIADNEDFEGGTFRDNPTTGDITLTLDSNGKVVAYLIPMEDVSDSVVLWVEVGDNTYIYPIPTEDWVSGLKYEYSVTVGETLDLDED